VTPELLARYQSLLLLRRNWNRSQPKSVCLRLPGTSTPCTHPTPSKRIRKHRALHRRCRSPLTPPPPSAPDAAYERPRHGNGHGKRRPPLLLLWRRRRRVHRRGPCPTRGQQPGAPPSQRTRDTVVRGFLQSTQCRLQMLRLHPRGPSSRPSAPLQPARLQSRCRAADAFK
jgi:hypothetical protein